MAVLSNQTIHACFAVAFRTQASTRFLTGEWVWVRYSRRFLIGHLSLYASWWTKVWIKSLKLILSLGFILSNKELTKCLNCKLKRLSSSLLIFCIQNKRFKGGLAVVSFPSSWFEAKVNLWELNFRCSALKCVEVQQLNIGLFFVVIPSDLER